MHADTPTCAALCCRIAAYVRQPIVSPVLHLMTNFSSWAHLCIQEHPSLVGQPFERLPLLFADATVAGIWDAATRSLDDQHIFFSLRGRQPSSGLQKALYFL